MRNTHDNLVGKSWGRLPFGRLSCRWGDNIKKTLRWTRC